MSAIFLEHALNGLQLGMMLFIIAAGLSLTLGLMNFVNLAHGSFYMIGAYLAASLTSWSGSFWIGLLLSVVITGAVGVIVEIVAIRKLYRRDHLDQVLFCVGLIFFLNEVVRLIWGSAALSINVPPLLAGTIILGTLQYPVYRLALIGLGLVVAGALYVLIAKTRIGMLVRAGASDIVMVGALGARIQLIFALVFGVGAALAGLAGLAMAPLLAVQLGMGNDVLILSLVVIVIGGLGSLQGAFIAAILVGLIDTAGRVLLPSSVAEVGIYILMASVLLLRPQGLLRHV